MMIRLGLRALRGGSGATGVLQAASAKAPPRAAHLWSVGRGAGAAAHKMQDGGTEQMTWRLGLLIGMTAIAVTIEQKEEKTYCMQRMGRQDSQQEPSAGGLRQSERSKKDGKKKKKAAAKVEEPTVDDGTPARHYFHRMDVNVDTLAAQFRGLRNLTFPAPWA